MRKKKGGGRTSGTMLGHRIGKSQEAMLVTQTPSWILEDEMEVARDEKNADGASFWGT